MGPVLSVGSDELRFVCVCVRVCACVYVLCYTPSLCTRRLGVRRVSPLVLKPLF